MIFYEPTSIISHCFWKSFRNKVFFILQSLKIWSSINNDWMSLLKSFRSVMYAIQIRCNSILQYFNHKNLSLNLKVNLRILQYACKWFICLKFSFKLIWYFQNFHHLFGNYENLWLYLSKSMVGKPWLALYMWKIKDNKNDDFLYLCSSGKWKQYKRKFNNIILEIIFENIFLNNLFLNKKFKDIWISINYYYFVIKTICD